MGEKRRIPPFVNKPRILTGVLLVPAIERGIMEPEEEESKVREALKILRQLHKAGRCKDEQISDAILDLETWLYIRGLGK